jgi:hypothetical protein
MSRYRDERDAAAKLATEHLETLRALFKQHGITLITVTYDGYGDDGSISRVSSAPPENWDKLKDTQFIHKGVPVTSEVLDWNTKPPVTRTVPTTVRDMLESAIYSLLSKDHGGWEIGAGSFGEFVITPTDIHLTHHTRFENYDTSESDYE